MLTTDTTPSILKVPMDGFCQQKALKKMKNAACDHLTEAFDALSGENPGKHFGVRGETYTYDVLLRALNIAYPKHDVTWTKIKIARNNNGDIADETLKALRRKYPHEDIWLYVDGIINSKVWHQLWADADEVAGKPHDQGIDHCDRNWIHSIAANLTDNAWYERQGSKADGWPEIKYQVCNLTDDVAKAKPILFGGESEQRYFRHINRVFIFFNKTAHKRVNGSKTVPKRVSKRKLTDISNGSS